MNKSISWRKGKKGFTIVELVVVIAVIAILAAVLIPTFVGLIQKANESTAFMDANNLVTTLIPELLDGENDTDLLIFSAKGGKIYVYGFRHDIRRVLPYWNNGADELKLADGDNFGDKITEILGKLATDGGRDNNACVTERTEITNDTNDWRHPNNLTNMLTKNGFNSNTMAIRANYSIDNNFFREEDVPNGGGHNHIYRYEEVDADNHRTICTECGFSDLEPHDFDADGKCTKCHYQKQKTLTLTGTYDEANDEYVFTIPEGTAANTIITLDFSGDAMNSLNDNAATNPGGMLAGFGVRIIDNSGNNFKISGAYFANDTLKQYMDPDGNYELPEVYTPQITQSTDFLAYMKETSESKDLAVGVAEVNEYRTKYKAGTLEETFTEYLKEKYKVSSLSDLPFLALHAVNGFPLPVWEDSGKDGLVNGNTTDLSHVEPEIIKLLVDGLYDDSVVYSFLPKYSDANKYVSGTQSPSWSLYKNYVSATWKTDCEAGGWDAHSLIELMNGERIPDGLNFTQTTSNGVTTTSGAILCWWHGYIAGNAYQNCTILGLTSMQITMTAE